MEHVARLGAVSRRKGQPRRASSNGGLSRIGMLWVSVRDSLWFLPALGAVIGAALAIAATYWVGPALHGVGWLFGGEATAARSVLSTIAGSLINVTGVTFSVTIVALQLASTQFTPRLLKSFMSDRANQIVLAIFIGTFTYTLIVLRSIRAAAGDDDKGFVPGFAVTFGVILLVVSVGALIYFIDHAARSVQAGFVLERETKRALSHVDALFPEHFGEPAEDDALPTPRGGCRAIVAERGGYLQAVHESALGDLAAEEGLTIVMQPFVGDRVLHGEPLALAYPARAIDVRLEGRIRDAFTVGTERTPEQDLEFFLIELSDIAVKALSPGINDPTTAILVLEHVAEVLVAFGNRRTPPPLRKTSDAGVYFLAKRTTFERAVAISFDRVRIYARSADVLAKLVEIASRTAELVPPGRRRCLEALIDRARDDAQRTVSAAHDRQSVDDAAARAQSDCT